jgi:hypothetical protein
MGIVRSVFHFHLDGIWVAGESLGRSATFARDGFRVQIDLPDDRNAFGLKRGPGVPFGAFGSHGSGPESARVQEVAAIRISVAGEADLCRADFAAPGEQSSPEAMKRARDFHTKTLDIAQSTVIDLVSWLRIEKDQVWLGLGANRPQLVGQTSYYDGDGQLLPVGFDEGVIIYPLDPAHAVDGPFLSRLVGLLGDGRPTVEVEDQLLADARQMIPSRPTDIRRSRRPLVQHAVLLAAVASEVKIKRTLRRVTSADKLALIDNILDNPREVSVAAVNLFHTTMNATIGRSLKKDDPNLFAAITRLFEVRNRVAHRGEQPSLEEARNLVAAAIGACKWLDELPDAPSLESAGATPSAAK